MAIATLTSNESGANSLIDINANFVDLDTTKADLASPTFTGTVTIPAIKITTGAGASKVLTSDADGDATWEALTGSSYKNGVTSRNVTTASGDQTIAHGLSTTPKYIRITVRQEGDYKNVSNGVYNGTTNSCVYTDLEGATAGNSATKIAIMGSPTNNQTATAAFDGTNITLSWVRTGSTASALMYIMWEAFA